MLIDPITGLLSTNDTFQPEYREFVPGTEPDKYAPPPTPEQIEKYLKEREEQRLQAAPEEEIEDPEDFEDELIGNPADVQVQGAQTAPTPIDGMPTPSARPVLIPREEIPPPPPIAQPTPEQPPRQEEPRKKRLFFRRFRENTDNPNPNIPPSPNQEPPRPSRLRRIFTSPYNDEQ